MRNFFICWSVLTGRRINPSSVKIVVLAIDLEIRRKLHDNVTVISDLRTEACRAKSAVLFVFFLNPLFGDTSVWSLANRIIEFNRLPEYINPPNDRDTRYKTY